MYSVVVPVASFGAGFVFGLVKEAFFKPKNTMWEKWDNHAPKIQIFNFGEYTDVASKIANDVGCEVSLIHTVNGSDLKKGDKLLEWASFIHSKMTNYPSALSVSDKLVTPIYMSYVARYIGCHTTYRVYWYISPTLGMVNVDFVPKHDVPLTKLNFKNIQIDKSDLNDDVVHIWFDWYGRHKADQSLNTQVTQRVAACGLKVTNIVYISPKTPEYGKDDLEDITSDIINILRKCNNTYPYGVSLTIDAPMEIAYLVGREIRSGKYRAFIGFNNWENCNVAVVDGIDISKMQNPNLVSW